MIILLKYFVSCFISDKKTCHFANDCGDHDCGDSGAPVCHHNVCSCESKEYRIIKQIYISIQNIAERRSTPYNDKWYLRLNGHFPDFIV